MAQNLNILCCNPKGGAFLYITRGWEAAFKAMGHNFQRWDGSDDHLKKFKPQLYLGCSGWRQDFPQWAKDEFGTKIAVHVNPWGSTILQPLPGEPNINEKKPIIDWVTKQNPDFLYCYGLEEDISHMWNKWEDNVTIVVPMPNGGDAVAHKPVDPDPDFACQVGFVGGRWAYKAKNIDKYLVPIFKQHKSRVFGWGGWKGIIPNPGPIDDKNVNKLFSSAKVCPAIVEPHTSRYGIDIPERMFKVPLGGGFVVCDPCKGLTRFVSKDVFPIAKNPAHYKKLIEHYVNNDAERIKLQKQQRLAIIKDHTYFSRIQTFLRFGGFEEEAEEAQKFVASMVEGVN
jgi:hypothetical protein